MNITEFLLARIAEDEDRAKRAAFGWGDTWRTVSDDEDEWYMIRAEGKREVVGGEDIDVIRHIANQDPARVLAECAAKRVILAHYERHRENRDARRSPRALEVEDERAAQERRTQEARTRTAEVAVLALAGVYKEHPDYQREWALE